MKLHRLPQAQQQRLPQNARKNSAGADGKGTIDDSTTSVDTADRVTIDDSSHYFPWCHFTTGRGVMIETPLVTTDKTVRRSTSNDIFGDRPGGRCNLVESPQVTKVV